MNPIDSSLLVNIPTVIFSGIFLAVFYYSPKHDKRITRGFSMHNVVWHVLLVIIFDILSFNLVSTVVVAIIVIALSTVGFHESKKPDDNVTEDQQEADE